MNFLKENKFLVFSPFRIILFCGLCGVLVFVGVMGQSLWWFYFGEGNTYVYRKGNLAVHFVDVGHGDCTVVQLPDGKVAVIDGGHEYYYPRVKRYIRERIKPKNNRIDYVINTHPHDDHLAGLLLLMEDFRVGKFFDHENITEGMVIGNNSYRIQFHAAKIREVDNIDDQYVNEYSPIITIEYASQVFIITGDAGHETERVFIESAAAQEIFDANRVDELTVYLQVGHHGSRSSTGIPFLNFVNPDVAIISLGFLYNHPHAEVIRNIKDRDAQILMTRDAGNIVFRCDGDRIKVFFSFDNPADLVYVWIVIFFALLFLCFNNYIVKFYRLWSRKSVDTIYCIV